MENRTTYLSVGLFLFLGVLALLYITLTLGDSELVDDEHYQLTARFVSASGLLLRGLPLGREAPASPPGLLVGHRLRSAPGAPVDEPAPGGAGGSDTYLEHGDEIIETESSINLEELISKYIFESK